jgi:leader peptidase (prepilin peptidase)/N-methyltransferase
VYSRYGFSFDGVAAAILVCLLVIASFIDLNLMLIPNLINLMIAITGIFYMLFGQGVTLKDSILGFILGGGILFLMGVLSNWILKKEGMGGGDIKLAAACGIYLGATKTVVALMLTVYTAGFILIIMLVMKKLRKDQCVPFGPFLSVGVIAVLLFYEQLRHILIAY